MALTYTDCVVEDNRDSAFDLTMNKIRIVSEHETVEEARSAQHPCGQHIMQHVTYSSGKHYYVFIGTVGFYTEPREKENDDNAAAAA